MNGKENICAVCVPQLLNIDIATFSTLCRGAFFISTGIPIIHSAEAEGRILHAEIMLDQLEIQRDHLNELADAGT